MKQTTTNQSSEPSKTIPTPRRPFLRAVAGLGAVGAFGLPTLATTVRAAIPGVSIEYKQCKVAFVSNGSAIDSLAVYYADSDGVRQARYAIDPIVTDTQTYDPLVVKYNSDKDRTQVQLTESQGALVCITAEAKHERTTQVNPTDRCVPAGFNTAPTASFSVSDDEPQVGDVVTLTSTATDSDDPERLHYEWDVDGDGVFETTGETATSSYTTPGDVTISHRVTDDCGASDTATQTITVQSASTVIPDTEVAKLLASDGEAGDIFGTSVSVDGDTALVGAGNEDEKGSNAGAAYVFTRSSGEWSQQAKLTASDAEAGDWFGRSVSVDGDTALVGAYREGEKGVDAGAAYVYTRNSGTWSEQAKLTASDAEAGDWYGFSVSVAGNTALVGALLEDEKGSQAGAVYVYTRSSGTWSEQAKLTASDGQADDNFGSSVSVADDTALVGVAGEDEKGSQAGAAYVYTRNSGTWSEQAKLTASDGQAGDIFGNSVSVDGNTALVGARLEDEKGFNAGAAYVYTRSSEAWTEQAKLTASDGERDDAFGRSVSVDGDTALVGAPGEDEKGNGAGAAYVYTRSSGTWSEQAKLTASDGQDFDLFGVVSVDGDTALVGAPGEDEKGNGAGAAYVFE